MSFRESIIIPKETFLNLVESNQFTPLEETAELSSSSSSEPAPLQISAKPLPLLGMTDGSTDQSSAAFLVRDKKREEEEQQQLGGGGKRRTKKTTTDQHKQQKEKGRRKS